MPTGPLEVFQDVNSTTFEQVGEQAGASTHSLILLTPDSTART